jgi:hypothetical protein
MMVMVVMMDISKMTLALDFELFTLKFGRNRLYD